MGISKQVLKAMRAENDYKALRGNFLSFGQQTINIDSQLLAEWLGDDAAGSLHLDDRTRHGKGHRVADKSLIETLFDVSYQTVDKSPYEGADFIIDLGKPIEKSFHESFDFVYSGGCLDNVFSPAEVIMNSSRLLRPGGRVMHYESGAGLVGAYTYLTAEWFLSYYAVNDFEDCKVYMLTQTTPGRARFDYDVDIFSYSHIFERTPDFSYFKAGQAMRGLWYLFVIAEKGPDSTCDRVPDQLQYLDEYSLDWRARANSYHNSPRALLEGIRGGVDESPYLSDHYEYLGSGF